MATRPTEPNVEGATSFATTGVSARRAQAAAPSATSERPGPDRPASGPPGQKPTQRDALQGLLAFSALHEQVRRRKALAARHKGLDVVAPVSEFEPEEFFILDEVLQLVAERAVAITGADGLAIALADKNEIVLRASAGTIKPDVGARIDRDSAFSGASFRTAQIVNCDDTEVDPRVNLQACRRLGARSMVAVPLCGRRRVIGLLEAFSSWPFGFNDSDVNNLTLLAELIVGALKPEDEDRFADSAAVAVAKLEAAPRPVAAPTSAPLQPARVEPAPAAVAPKPVPPATPPVKIAPPARVELPAAAATLAAKPAQTAAAVAPSIPTRPAIPQKPAGEKIVETRASQAAPDSAPTFGQLEPERAPHRPLMVALLVSIVVAAAVAGGVWWKWKTAQLGSEMVQAEKISSHPTGTATSNYQPPPAPAASGPATSQVPGASPAPTAASEANEPVLTPATPQELAKFPRVTGIRHWSSADSSTVVIDLEDQVQYEQHRLANPDRLYFDLHDTQLVPDLAGKSIEVGDPLLNRVRVAQPVAGLTRIVLEIRTDANFSVSLEPNPYRLVVEVRKIGAAPKGAVNLFPRAEANKVAIVVPPPTREDLQLRARVPKMRVVVDAGHGGWDLGTVGRRGLLEKDLVLEIAQRLGKLLESRLGADVILTRNDDNYIPLDDRAEMANQAQADLFISVHANYSDLPSARGVETYYTNSFSAPGASETGSKDAGSNIDVHATGAKPAVTPTLTPAELHDRVEQSRRLAASVQRSLYGTLSASNPGLRDRGIKEAGFVVLTESAMPGILAEVSFVSSPTDEQKLESDRYREQIAEALYKGIARYAASSKGVKVAGAAK